MNDIAAKSTDLQKTIDQAWEDRQSISAATKGPVREAVEAALDGLDAGTLRVAEKSGGKWTVNQWLKKAVLLSFRLYDSALMPGGPRDPARGEAPWFDKVAPKFAGWDDARFKKAGFRAVPNCVVRRSAFIAPNVILMPSFVNVGAYVDSGTMVDTWATVGSCAQIGKNCHISGGAVPSRAYRFSTSGVFGAENFRRWQVKPSGVSAASSTPSAPASAGVTLGQRISAWASGSASTLLTRATAR